MKKYLTKTTLILLTAIILSGCNDWLEVRPKTEIRAYDLFTSDQGFWDALTGIYIGMTDQRLYGRNLSWDAIEWMAWYHNSGNENSSWFQLQRYNFEDRTAIPFIDNVWSRMYNVISEINFLLWALDRFGHILSTEVYNTVKGEALALRAFCHFDLIRLFAQGNLANNPAAFDRLTIPYVTEHSKHIVPQRTYRETINLLMKDVNEAIELLSQVRRPAATPYFTMNDLAAKLLRARIAQWTNDPNTVAYSADLITSLMAGESALRFWGNSTVTDRNRHLPTEVMFGLDVFRLRTLMERAYISHIGGSPNLNILQNSVHFVDNDIFEVGREPIGVSPADIRIRGTMNWFSVEGSNKLFVKLQQPADGAAINVVPLMRLSEAFLIYAESMIGTSNASAAIALNMLRIGGRGNDLDYTLPDDLSDETLRRIIQQEYRREFMQEGQLFFYYKRNGVLRIPGAPAGVGEMTNERYTLPFPIAEQEFGRVGMDK